MKLIQINSSEYINKETITNIRFGDNGRMLIFMLDMPSASTVDPHMVSSVCSYLNITPLNGCKPA